MSISFDLKVPELALCIFREFHKITLCENMCIGGGFPRGLFMQQALHSPTQMNDIDIFADLTLGNFENIKAYLVRLLGKPIRQHIGFFDDETNPRCLIEFLLPEQNRQECGGVQSVQFNFGPQHPWADANDFVANANLGIIVNPIINRTY